LVLARYARAATGPIDGLALTHLDAFDRTADWRLAPAYDDGRLHDWPLDPPLDFTRRTETSRRLMHTTPVLVSARPGVIEDAISGAYRAPVLLRSTGPKCGHVANLANLNGGL
jgi:hypothetical protein